MAFGAIAGKLLSALGSVAVRLMAGLVVFLILARELGPAAFGAFSAVLAGCTLVGLASNLALPLMVLRDGAETGRLANELDAAFRLRNLAAGVTLLAGGVALLLLPASISWASLLLLAVLAEGYTDLHIASLRARHRHHGELCIGIVAAGLGVSLVFAAMAWSVSLVSAALAYLLPRLLVSCYAVLRISRDAAAATERPGWRKTWLRTRASFGELTLQTVLVQADVLVVSAVAGAAQAGLYQAVMRVVHALSQVISIASNVFVPKAVSYAAEPVKQARVLRQARWLLLGAGAALLLPLTMAAQPITALLLGDKFAAAAGLMPWAGFLLLLRFGAAAEGIRMIVARSNKQRLASLAVGLGLAFPLGFVTSHHLGALGMLVSMGLGFAGIWLSAWWSGRARTSAA